MSDDPLYSAFHKLPPKPPQPRELLFEFVRGSDHARVRCELRVHGESSVEAQFFVNEKFRIGEWFLTRALAARWAELEREHFERGGD
jgi:hypothetical protein